MFIAFDFKNDLNSCFSRMKLYTFSDVLNLNNVCIISSAHVNKPCERAGAVGQAYKDGEAAAFIGFVAAHEVGDEADVYVSAGKHDACAAGSGWCYQLSE